MPQRYAHRSKNRIQDEMSTEQKQTPDTSTENPSHPQPGDASSNGGEQVIEGKHPDAPDHPTTPYDHIWYERRPLH